MKLATNHLKNGSSNLSKEDLKQNIICGINYTLRDKEAYEKYVTENTEDGQK